jgi:exosortase A-associated hydrolase 1
MESLASLGSPSQDAANDRARSERPVTFDCEGETLIGVVSLPPAAARVGLVILPGGPNYRAGAHRQFVHLARSVAVDGIAALRFDYRGMGDSAGTFPGFENVEADVRAAIDAFLAACPGVERVVLAGLCEGASSALLYYGDTADVRVAGLVLANPWVRSEATLAKTYIRHYYAKRLMARSFWSKLLRGRFDVRTSVRGLARDALVATRSENGVAYPRRMAAALASFRGPVLLALSSDDLTAREFADHAARDAHWRDLLSRTNVERCEFTADHTFSSSPAREAFETRVRTWLRLLQARAPAATRA